MNFATILERVSPPKKIDGIKLMDVTIAINKSKYPILVATATHNPTGISVTGEGRRGEALRDELIKKLAIKIKEN